MAGTRPLDEMSESGIISLTPENFNSYKAKIRKNLGKGFGLHAVSELVIESVGRRSDTRYGVKIEKEKIRILI